MKGYGRGPDWDDWRDLENLFTELKEQVDSLLADWETFKTDQEKSTPRGRK